MYDYMTICTDPAPEVVALALQGSMATAARRRLLKDFRKLEADPPEGISAAPQPDNIMQWQAVILG